MASTHLATYLNAHLAGSVVALELLEHLAKAHADAALQRFCADLHADIAADRDELEALMGRLQIAKSTTRQAAAWVTEKITRFKLQIDDRTGGGSLHLFEALEAVALGIDGKLALWRALASAAEASPGLQGVDYERLARHAQEQRARVELRRLAAAKSALGG